MLLTHKPSRPRQAFTLIELLVVIAIIATLIGLLLAGVMAVMNVRYRTQTQYEITKMTEGMQAALKDYRGAPKWLPSQLILYNDLSQYNAPNANQLVKQSKQALQQMFGRRLFTPGNKVAWSASGTVALQGQQCLVWYLGGIQTTTGTAHGCLGFADDPLNPMKVGGNRKGPYFDFKSTRLVADPKTGFFSYLDPYGTPYAYFSTVGSANNYSLTDCSALNVQPYYVNGSNPVQFMNPNAFQIISAGKDKVFGPGGPWDPTVGVNNINGMDDMSNFSKSVLAAPQS